MSTNTNKLLYHATKPYLSSTNQWEVAGRGFRINAAQLSTGDEFIVEVATRVMGLNGLYEPLWYPLTHCEVQIAISVNRPQFTTRRAGLYRLVPNGAPSATAVVVMEEYDLNTDSDVFDDLAKDCAEVTPPAVIPCSTPPIPDGDTLIAVKRCTPTGEITLLVKAEKANNVSCPPTAGSIGVIGYINQAGAVVMGQYTGQIIDCATATATAPKKKLVTERFVGPLTVTKADLNLGGGKLVSIDVNVDSALPDNDPTATPNGSIFKGVGGSSGVLLVLDEWYRSSTTAHLPSQSYFEVDDFEIVIAAGDTVEVFGEAIL